MPVMTGAAGVLCTAGVLGVTAGTGGEMTGGWEPGEVATGNAEVGELGVTVPSG